jgi:hypothetical protein
MLWKFIHLFQLLTIITLGWTVSKGTAEDTRPNTTSLPYPSAEFCQHNEIGSDLYISLFSPCVFTFYKGWSNITQEESFSCIGIVNSTNEVIIAVKESKVVGWPDPCVANGPRCYDLSEYPDLSNFTIYGESMGNVYPMKFPEDSSYVSVDCSKDYQIAKETMKKIPEAIEPLTNAIIFFGLMVLIGSIICCCVCCACICREGGHQRANTRYNYSNITGVYAGPPVEAKRIL